jgi:hypothetical protein
MLEQKKEGSVLEIGRISAKTGLVEPLPATVGETEEAEQVDMFAMLTH